MNLATMSGVKTMFAPQLVQFSDAIIDREALLALVGPLFVGVGFFF